MRQVVHSIKGIIFHLFAYFTLYWKWAVSFLLLFMMLLLKLSSQYASFNAPVGELEGDGKPLSTCKFVIPPLHQANPLHAVIGRAW